MTDTIRLSDRLELRERGDSYYGLHVDGEHRNSLNAATADALIEACNPPRLILPPGVIHGSDGKFYAPGHAAEGLDRDLWTPFTNETAIISRLSPYANYEVRPTAANPLPTLPATCWQIPDGRICCLRKDAQALRDMGWTIVFTSNGRTVDAEYDADYPLYVVEARPPAKPDTERVLWWEALGRALPDGRTITQVADDLEGGPFFRCGADTQSVFCIVDGSSTVEVLR